jgi:acetyltransferase-like isoleucine patch superfamily enzyme
MKATPMVAKLIRRFMLPQFVVTIIYLLKFGAKISFRAEVELSSNIKMGKGVIVSSFTKIKASDGVLELGAGSGFATGCFIASGEKGIIAGENFLCGPNVSIVASNFVINRLNEGIHTSRGIRIGNNVWVGANASILDGSEIGDNTVVYANSVVSGKHPPNVILRGCPATVIFENKPKRAQRKKVAKRSAELV